MVDDRDGGPGAGAPGADHAVLRLSHLSTTPDPTAIDVKRTVRRPLLGATATVRVIGSSHWLSVPARSFHELCSCRPLPDVGVARTDGDDPHPDGGVPGRADDGRREVTVPAARVRRVPLARGIERTVTTTVGEVHAETVVEGLALDAFPAERPFDVRYRFGPDAVTAIALDDDRFETFHTYPEYDLALRSATELTRTD